MVRSGIGTAAAAALIAGLLSGGTSWAVHPRDMVFEPLHWDPPVPERVVLANGLVAHLLEDDEIPLVEITVYVRTGSVYDPPEESGLARLAGSAIRGGGTGSHSADEIDAAIENMAAGFDLYVRPTYMAAALSVLRKDIDEGLGILAEVLRDPAFEPDRVDLFRQERLEEIRRRYDRPPRIASALFRRRVYGETGPWARFASPESVGRITREDLAAFHSRYFKPNNLIVTMSGDLTREEMLGKLERFFGDWPSGPVTFPDLPELELRFEPSVDFLQKDLSQSYLRVGHLGYRYHDPDEFSIEMMNYVLGGGGFLSRLVREVRSRRGLAYSIKSDYSPDQDRGLFEVECVTDAGKTHEALTLILEIIREMLDAPPGEDELERAKEARINEFVFAFDSRLRIVRQAGWLEYQGYPEGYLESWVDRVRAVTPADVLDAAQRYLHPDGLAIAVVGNESRFDGPLGDFGEVRRVEIGELE
jgi:zinc protease